MIVFQAERQTKDTLWRNLVSSSPAGATGRVYSVRITAMKASTYTNRAIHRAWCGVAVVWLAANQPLGGETKITLRETEFAGLAHYEVTTSAATYFLERSGAGISRLIDRQGNDWLGFDPTPGSGAAGEFRGFPNAVHQQAGNYFHPRNQATDPSQVKVEHADAKRVTISAESSNRMWACRYDFFADRCVFTMTKMPADKKYWVLYEGTPGGQFDAADWWMTSAVKTRQPIDQPHDGDLEAPEWIAFGDAKLGRALFLLHHEDDLHPDRYYPMQSQMTVFGFGRAGGKKFLDRAAQSFAIGFLETTNHSEISSAIDKLQRH